MTKQYKCFKFEKLVRDKNKKTIEKSGGEFFGYKLKKDDFIQHLKLKLVEEAKEVLDAKTLDETADEIGDVIEVLKSLVKQMKIKKRKINKCRKIKAKNRGKFKKGIYCKYVKFPISINEKWMDKYENLNEEDIISSK